MPLASQPLAAFVPHDLKASISGAATGPLAGLVGAVKDMYDIAGYRTGGGSPDWLAAASEATRKRYSSSFRSESAIMRFAY